MHLQIPPLALGERKIGKKVFETEFLSFAQNISLNFIMLLKDFIAHFSSKLCRIFNRIFKIREKTIKIVNIVQSLVPASLLIYLSFSIYLSLSVDLSLSICSYMYSRVKPTRVGSGITSHY